jgi:hypothetical protein
MESVGPRSPPGGSPAESSLPPLPARGRGGGQVSLVALAAARSGPPVSRRSPVDRTQTPSRPLRPPAPPPLAAKGDLAPAPDPPFD